MRRLKKTRCPRLQGSQCLPLKVRTLRFLQTLGTGYAVMRRDTEDRKPQLQHCEKLKTCIMYSLFRETNPALFSRRLIFYSGASSLICTFIHCPNYCTSVQFPVAAVGTPSSVQKVPGSLPDNFSFSPAAQGLLQRLLEPDPRARLRSLLALQGIAFFKDFSFADARAKKVRPELSGLSTCILILFCHPFSCSYGSHLTVNHNSLELTNLTILTERVTESVAP